MNKGTTIEVRYNYHYDQNGYDKVRFSSLKDFANWYKDFKGKGTIWDIIEI